MKTTQQRFDDYMNTYNGRNLKYTLNTFGVWRVLGEDPNCDFGGHHYEPDLGVYEGKLKDIIWMAVDMKNFWSWGGGGRFELLQIKKIDESTIEQMKQLENEKKSLELRLKEIDSILK